MIFFKVTGAVLLVGSGISAARTLNKRAERELGQLEGLARMVEFIKKRVECFSEPLPAILAAAKRDKDMPRVAEMCGYKVDCLPSCLEDLRDGYERYSKRGTAIFESFLSDFGKCYRQRQIALCDSAAAELWEEYRRYSLDLPNKKRLNLTLCMAGALIPLILLI